MIRTARRDDLNELVAIEQRCFTTNRLSRRRLHYMVHNPKARMLVFEEQGVVCGYLLTFVHARSKLARHYSLAVLPQHRRKGIAERLLKTMEDQCGKMGVKLEIRADNKMAMTLYARLGYQMRRRIESFYEDGMDALEMVKML